MLDKVVAALEKVAKGCVIEKMPVTEDDRLQIDRKHIVAVCKELKENSTFDFAMLVDQTCVDYLGDEERFEVIYQLNSLKNNYRLRLKVRVPEGENLPTVSGLWKIANPFEREIWDMFGVVFDGHPNLKRILMYDEFEGHPLRKDYPLKKHQPRIEMRKPIETTDDPPYNWTEFQRKRKLGLED